MKPGIYSMEAEAYFHAEGVSRSMLEIIVKSCPAKLKAQLDGACERSTHPLQFGAQFHRMIGEPETMESAWHIRPDGMKFNTKEGKAWKLAHDDRPIVYAEEVAAMRGMILSLSRNSEFMRLWSDGASEQSLFAEDGSGTLRKGRLDRFHGRGNFLLDLKTCESADRWSFSKSIANYGWHRQGAYYLDLATLCGMRKEVFILAAIEKTPPYISKLYRIDDEALEIGAEDMEKALESYRSCMASGIWPDYGPMEELGLPQKLRREPITAL